MNNITNSCRAGVCREVRGNIMINLFFAIVGLGSTLARDADMALDRILDFFIPIKPIQIEDDI